MIIRTFDTQKQVEKACASLFLAQLLQKPDSVLGLATGSSPIGVYQQLIAWHKEGLLDCSKALSFNLDEYIGIAEDNPCSYHRFMKEQLFDHIPFKASYLPNGNAEDLAAECLAYDQRIQAAGGIDLQLLGIGENAHIGFNEPDAGFCYGTQVVDLTESTIKANRRFFSSEEEVPRRAISMGIGTIMAADKIVLIAMGKQKAKAIASLLKPSVDPKAPASVLRLHKRALILIDKEAASLL